MIIISPLAKGSTPSSRNKSYLNLYLQYRMYRVRGSSGQPMNFRLCDTRGIEENQEMDANSVSYLLEGNVPEGHQVGW